MLNSFFIFVYANNREWQYTNPACGSRLHSASPTASKSRNSQQRSQRLVLEQLLRKPAFGFGMNFAYAENHIQLSTFRLNFCAFNVWRKTRRLESICKKTFPGLPAKSVVFQHMFHSFRIVGDIFT